MPDRRYLIFPVPVIYRWQTKRFLIFINCETLIIQIYKKILIGVYPKNAIRIISFLGMADWNKGSHSHIDRFSDLISYALRNSALSCRPYASILTIMNSNLQVNAELFDMQIKHI